MHCKASALKLLPPHSVLQACEMLDNTLEGRALEFGGIRSIVSGSDASHAFVFPQASIALAWCLEVQRALLRIRWPNDLDRHQHS